ncbi:MAG TPA: hypothetical protein VI542_31455 [Candidatus Tectomicrobia bacterium]
MSVVLIGQPKVCPLTVHNVRAMRRLTTLAVPQPHGKVATQGEPAF